MLARTRSLLLISFLLTGFFLAPAAWGWSNTPAFTGDVEADFFQGEMIPVGDPNNDVGLPVSFPQGVVSGWEIKDLRLFYDRDTDTLFVGINVDGIAGDADGDGDPGQTAPYLADLDGEDIPSMGESEFFVVSFDTDRDGLADAVSGVSLLGDINSFGTAEAIQGAPLPFAFGTALPQHTGALFADPEASAPDLEFTVPMFSQLPGFNMTRGELTITESLIFNVSATMGSSADAGIGEDVINPALLVYGKVSFDIGLQEGEIVSDQFAEEGLLLSALSDCGTPGAFVNDPSNNPTTTDIVPCTPPFVLSTRCNPEDDTSDSGEIFFTFVNPLSSNLPADALWMGLCFLDIEGSGTPGRGNSKLTLFGTDGDIVCIPVPSGPDGNQFMISFPQFGGTRGRDVFTFGEGKGRAGDISDSGGVDPICYNLCPTPLGFTINIEAPHEPVVVGGMLNIPISVTNPTNERQRGVFSMTAGVSPRGHRRVLMEEQEISLRPGYQNREEPHMVSIQIPENLSPRLESRTIRIRAKITHPDSGKIIAQDIVDLNLARSVR